MNNKYMKVLGAVCIAIIVIELLIGLVAQVTGVFVHFLDDKISMAIRQERSYIYEDLAELNPGRVVMSRHGAYHIVDGGK